MREGALSRCDSATPGAAASAPLRGRARRARAPADAASDDRMELRPPDGGGTPSARQPGGLLGRLRARGRTTGVRHRSGDAAGARRQELASPRRRALLDAGDDLRVRRRAAELNRRRKAGTNGARRVFVGQAEAAAPELTGGAQTRLLALLAEDHANFPPRSRGRTRPATASCDEALRSALAFLVIHGHLSEGRRWLESALTIDSGSRPRSPARALRRSGPGLGSR